MIIRKRIPSKVNDQIILFTSLAITLVMYSFFSLRTVNGNVAKGLNMMLALVLFSLSLPNVMSRDNFKNAYSPYIRGIVLISTFSILSAYFFWNQSLLLGYRVSYYFLFISLFFIMLNYRISLNVIQKYVLILGVAYCIAWIVGFLTLPLPVFGGFSGEDQGEIDLSRGIARLTITGKSTLVLAYFLCLTKFVYEGKKLYIYLGVIFFIFIVLQLVRQIILLSFIVGVLFFLRKMKYRIIFLLLISFLYISGLFTLISKNQIMSNLTELSENQIQANKDDEDIRIKEYKYFFLEYTENIVAVFLGNGLPHSEAGYGKKYEKLNQYGYFLTDVGYSMMYVVTGIIGLFLYLALFVLSSLRHCRKNVMFARLFMIYFLFANIAASWYAKVDGIICICICAYLLGNDYLLRNRTIKTNANICNNSCI